MSIGEKIRKKLSWKGIELIGLQSLVVDTLLDSALQGIYATPIDQLSSQVLAKQYQ